MTTTDVTLTTDGTWTTVSTTTTALIQNISQLPIRYRFGTSTSVGHTLDPEGSIVVTENVAFQAVPSSGVVNKIVVTK